MKIIALVSCVMATCVLSACTTTPPLKPAVVVNIVAKPKAGLNKPFEHVAVYDAAPKAAAAIGQFEQVDYSNVTDIVIWLEPLHPATAKATPDHHVFVVDTEHPNSVMSVVSVGDTVEFRNPFPERAQSVYSVSDGNEFDFPSIQSGAPASFVPRAEGLIEVLSNPALPPNRHIFAAPSPWVTIGRSGKSVTFYDVPPGDYRVVTWHARLPGSTSTITLRPDEVTETTVTIGVNALSDTSR